MVYAAVVMTSVLAFQFRTFEFVALLLRGAVVHQLGTLEGSDNVHGGCLSQMVGAVGYGSLRCL